MARSLQASTALQREGQDIIEAQQSHASSPKLEGQLLSSRGSPTVAALSPAGIRRKMAHKVFIACIAMAFVSTVKAQTNASSPLIDYFSKTNSSTYSYFWTALQAAHLDDYLDDSSLQLTVFAPTNDAWIKRLPTLTNNNGITVNDLFSESKSAALQNMLQYHILNQPRLTSTFTDEDYLSTLANLCSDAKTLQTSVSDDGAITLLSAGGSRPKLLDRGIVVGNSARSVVYAIDDVLLPSVVTIPLSVALSSGNGSANVYSPAIASQQDVLQTLQDQTQDEAPAPIYLAPQTPPTEAPTTSLAAQG